MITKQSWKTKWGSLAWIHSRGIVILEVRMVCLFLQRLWVEGPHWSSWAWTSAEPQTEPHVLMGYHILTSKLAQFWDHAIPIWSQGFLTPKYSPKYTSRIPSTDQNTRKWYEKRPVSFFRGSVPWGSGNAFQGGLLSVERLSILWGDNMISKPRSRYPPYIRRDTFST